MRIANCSLFLALAVSIVTAGGASIRTAAAAGYACEDDLIEIMFVPGSRVLLRAGAPVDLHGAATEGVEELLQGAAWHEWHRIADVSAARLDELRAKGEARTGKLLYDLNNIYRLRVPKDTDVRALSRKLEELPGVHLARPVPRPMFPPNPADFEPQQNYLQAAALAPTGIDAEYAWAFPGGDGSGVTICDLEYEWNYQHADVTAALGSQLNVDVGEPGYGPDHGTAVAGIMVADDNGWGITGITPGASLKTCATYFGSPAPAWNVPGALLLAIASLQAGDVILLENQWDLTGLGDYGPIEWWTDTYPDPQSYNAVYAAIETAVANGIHVVETGGNGEGDSGILTWYGDSGAIIVGAGGAYAGGIYPGGDLQKLWYSTYGPRFDLQGWGEDVVTTGFGDLYDAEGPDYLYTSLFDGTSAAGAIVAGAVASCVGYWKANISPGPPPPSLIRDILKSTGTPQVTPPDGNIGPRPDLQAAFAALGATTVDAGDVPRARIVLEQNVPNPMNPSTSITHYSPDAGIRKLTVYDIRGRFVRQLVEGWQQAGEFTTDWDGTSADGLPVVSGLYMVRLEAAGESRTIKALLIK